MRPHVLALVLAALATLASLASDARAEDPPRVDILAVLGLEAERNVAGVGPANPLPCRVVDARRARMFDPGQRVILHGRGDGSFRVVPDTEGTLACAVGFTVHVVDFLPPATALRALGLAESDEPIPERDHRRTTVARMEPLVELGLSPDGIGALVSVHNHGGGRWNVSTFGRTPSFTYVEMGPLFQLRSTLTEPLERATITIRVETLPEGGRLLARAAAPARLASIGLPEMPEGHEVLVERRAGDRLVLTTLSPGFTRHVDVEGFDLEAFGLDRIRLLDLPVEASVEGRVATGWKAVRFGLRGARSRGTVVISREAEGGYVVRTQDSRRAPAEVRIGD